MVVSAPPLSFLTIKMANIWQIRGAPVRRAVESAHKFYSISFYIDDSTFELSLDLIPDHLPYLKK